jgi:hypothetical protein
VGFSIPISRMFSGAVVWRGIIYTVLMLVGKALCGLWLVRFSIPVKDTLAKSFGLMASVLRTFTHQLPFGRSVHQSITPRENSTSATVELPEQGTSPPEHPAPAALCGARKASKPPRKPLSLYPAAIMSFAMIARGEIGFLISSVAESNDIFRGFTPSSTSSGEASEIFLIITWAIVLCTVTGPLCVGLLVRRVKKLEAESAAPQIEGAKRDVLGAWGVS